MPTNACKKPKLKQAFYNYERLKRGQIPYGYDRWPDGTEASKVVKPIPLAPTSDDINSRLDVPKGTSQVTRMLECQSEPRGEDSARPTRVDNGVLPFYDHYHLGLVVA